MSRFHPIAFVSTVLQSTVFPWKGKGAVAARGMHVTGILIAVTLSVLCAGTGPVSADMDIEQTLSDGAQRCTIAFDGFAFITGNLEAQSFFPPGKVADYWGFQYLRDNTPNGNGHNTSFLTNCAFNILFILNGEQFAMLKTLATRQVDQINLYAYGRYPLMKAFRRQLDGDLPAGSSGLSLEAVKEVSRDLYELDGQISFDRAVVYASIFKTLDVSQKVHLEAMKAGGFDSWTVTPEMDSAVRELMKGVSHDVSVALMTYAGDLFSWYAGSPEADVYFCPERQGTYFGSFYVKDAPAIGHEGYTINEQLTASAGQMFLDELAVTHLDTLVTNLVDQQRSHLYAGTRNIVQMRTDISVLLRSLITAPSLTEAFKAEVLAQVLDKSRTYGELDGEIVYSYAMAFSQVYESMTPAQKANLTALRKTILSGEYNGVPFDFSVCTTPFLYSAVIQDPSVLSPYISNTDDLFAFESDVNFIATELLGRPTDTSVTVNAVADVDLEVYLEYGKLPGSYTKHTPRVSFPGGTPIEIVIHGLQPDTQYYYRMNFRKPATEEVEFSHRNEYSFHTQRSPGSPFTFVVQADSHLYDPKCIPEIYATTLQNELTDAPDFFIELGDTFGADKFIPPDEEEIAGLHLAQRPYFGRVGHSAPLFFVLGNHEGEAGYELDGTADNIVVYATKARKLYYPNPVPDGFYTGNSASEDYVGAPEDYYAWEWGDALFVVLDPYRYTTTNPKVSGDLWDWTLGEDQYHWFKQTLENSRARFKFVFAHHVLGDMRGAVRWADRYEWGGYNADGIWEFDTKRPGWAMPIHPLMVTNGVTLFFQGHDHLFAKEELDGIVYQTVPQPSFPTGSMPNAEYFSGDVLPASGHLRVKVSESDVTVEYIRAYLPGEGTNGEVAYTYTRTANGLPTVTVFPTLPDAAEEGRDKGQFGIHRTGDTSHPLTVSYAVSGTGTNRVDYTRLSGSATIPAKASSVSINVVPINDGIFEEDETVVLTLQAGAAYLLGEPNSATVTIADNDLPAVRITAADADASETGTDPAQFTVSRTGSTHVPLVVYYTVSGTATNETDYAAVGNSITLPAGASSGVLVINPVDDQDYERSETVTVTLTADPGYILGSSKTATVTIADNDLPTVTVVASDTEASEAGANKGQFTVSRTGVTGKSLRVRYSLSGTATNGTDYTRRSGVVTIPARSVSATFTVSPKDDTIHEGDEIVVVTLTPDSSYAVGSPGEAALAIMDND